MLPQYCPSYSVIDYFLYWSGLRLRLKYRLVTSRAHTGDSGTDQGWQDTSSRASCTCVMFCMTGHEVRRMLCQLFCHQASLHTSGKPLIFIISSSSSSLAFYCMLTTCLCQGRLLRLYLRNPYNWGFGRLWAFSCL